MTRQEGRSSGRVGFQQSARAGPPRSCRGARLRQGIELDWAQLFWNYRTDEFVAGSGDTVAPPASAILDMWLASYPWPVNQGFFADFRDGAETILETFGPANPASEGLERFDGIAAAAGIDH